MLYNFVNQDYHCLNEDTKWKKGIKKIPTNICKWPLKFNVDADKIMDMVVFRENFAHADNPAVTFHKVNWF